MNSQIGEMVRSKVAQSKQLPKWALLRLATVTGRPPGFWKVLLLSGVTGAIASIVVLLLGRSVSVSDSVQRVPSSERSLNSGPGR